MVNSFRRGHRIASDRYLGTVMVGGPIFIQSFVNLLQHLKIGSGKYTFVSTFDEALAVVDAKIADQMLS